MTGAQLRKRRNQLGLTQAGLANQLGVAPNTVARYEREELTIPEPVARWVKLFQQKQTPKETRQ